MKKEAREIIEEKVLTDETIVSFCSASTPLKMWHLFLIGPFATLLMKHYLLAITDKGVHFHKIKMKLFGGKLEAESYNFFRWNDIESLKVKKGWIQLPVEFQFNNGNKLALRCQLKGIEKLPKLNEMGQEMLKTYKTVA